MLAMILPLFLSYNFKAKIFEENLSSLHTAAPPLGNAAQHCSIDPSISANLAIMIATTVVVLLGFVRAILPQNLPRSEFKCQLGQNKPM